MVASIHHIKSVLLHGCFVRAKNYELMRFTMLCLDNTLNQSSTGRILFTKKHKQYYWLTTGANLT